MFYEWRNRGGRGNIEKERIRISMDNRGINGFFFFLEGEREIYQRDERINQSAIMVKDSVLLRASKLESRVS